MGQAVSVHELVQKTIPVQSPTTAATNKQSPADPLSRSTSYRSMSQMSQTSNFSTISTVSMSDKFVSHDIALQIPSNSSQLSWRLYVSPTLTEDGMDCMSSMDTNQSICVVFGVCDSALLDKGYKHKYFGFGYCVTFCHNIKFQSFATTFSMQSEIEIKYDPFTKQISFWSNGEMKERVIRIDSSIDNVITVKCYNDLYDLQLTNS